MEILWGRIMPCEITWATRVSGHLGYEWLRWLHRTHSVAWSPIRSSSAVAGIGAVALLANTLMATPAAAQGACGVVDPVTGFVECKSDAATVAAIQAAGTLTSAGVAYAAPNLTVKLKDGIVFTVPGVGVAAAGAITSTVLIAGGADIGAGLIGVENFSATGTATTSLSSGVNLLAGGAGILTQAGAGLASVNVSSGSTVTAGGIALSANAAAGVASVAVSSGSFITAGGIGIQAASLAGKATVSTSSGAFISAGGIGISASTLAGMAEVKNDAQISAVGIGITANAVGDVTIKTGETGTIDVARLIVDPIGVNAVSSGNTLIALNGKIQSVGGNGGHGVVSKNTGGSDKSHSIKVRDVEASLDGIRATTTGGARTSVSVGRIDAGRDAVRVNANNGSVSVKVASTVKAGDNAVDVCAASSDVTLLVENVGKLVATNDAVLINTAGKVTIDQEAEITSTNGRAINVARAGDARLTLEADLFAGTDGVNVSGSGAVSVHQSHLAKIAAGRDGLKAGSTGGAVTITQDETLTVGRDAIVVTGTGGTAMSTVNSNVAIVAPRNAILATNVNGPLTINANKSLTAETGIDVSGNNAAGAVTMNLYDALHASMVGVRTNTVAGSVLNIASTASIAVDTDLAVEALKGPITINNDGLLTGFMNLSPGDDTFNNNSSQTWFTHSAGTSGSISTFGAGIDTINNTGRTVAARDANIVETVEFRGLEFLNNGDPTHSEVGLITLLDGAVNDRLITSGTFTGVGNSTFAVDAFLGAPGSTADRLIVGTATSGATAIVINNTNPDPGSYNPVGIEVVDVSAGTTAAPHFELAQGRIDRGFFFYDLLLRPDNVHVLAGIPGQEVFETPRIVTAVQDIWHQTAGVWLDRQSDLRAQLHGYSSRGVGPGLWTELIGSMSKRKVVQDFSLFNGHYSFDVSYEQQLYGFTSGIDFGSEGLFGPHDAWLVGVLAGYIDSRVDFDASATAVENQGATVGVYATYLNQAFFIDALVKADFLTVDYAAPSLRPFVDTADAKALSIGARIDSGFRVPFGATGFIDPLATVSYVSTEIDDMALSGATVDYGDNDSLQGRLGLRIGGEVFRTPGFRAEASLTASVWQELLPKNEVTIISNGPNLIATDDFDETFAEFSGSFNLFDLGGGFSGHVKGDFRFADNGEIWTAKIKGGMRYQW